MKIGKKTEAKIEMQMTPMIDVTFQLLTFFMMTLKIIEVEGDFNVNMPASAVSQASPEEPHFPDIKVKLEANSDGSLRLVRFGARSLGNDPQVFQRLNGEILRIIGYAGNPLTKDIEVEIDADYNLHYRYTLAAVSACTGRLGKEGQIVRYVEKIKFTPPKRPPAATGG